MILALGLISIILSARGPWFESVSRPALNFFGRFFLFLSIYRRHSFAFVVPETPYMLMLPYILKY